MRAGIALKINLIVLAVVFSLGTILAGYFLQEQYTSLQEELRRRIELFGGYLAKTLEGHQHGDGGMDQHLKAAVLDPEICYIIVKSAEGEIRAARWINSNAHNIFEVAFPLHAVGGSPGGPAFGEVNGNAGHQVDGSLTIGVDASHVTKSMQRLFWRTGIAVNVAALVAMVIGFFYVHFFLRNSITPFLYGIREIGEGSLTYRFSGDRKDELGEIGRAFNDMADRLRQTLFTKEQLETTVAERTAALESALAEQVRSKNEVVAKEARIKLLLDSTAEAIYGLDVEGNCIFCNAACVAMLGYGSEQQLLGKNMHSLLHHTRPDGTPYQMERCGIFDAFRKGERYHCDREFFWRIDGTPIPAEYWAYPVREGERITGAVVTFLDISERIRLTEQLVQAQKLESIGRLTGGVAHDFNNLLTPIMGYTEILRKDLAGNDQAVAMLSNVLKAAGKARELVKQLLSFSRKQVLEMKVMDLSEVIGGLKGILRHTIRESVELRFNLAPQRYGVRADRNQIEQVIMNLAVNAQDAIAGHGTIIIETGPVLLDNEYAGLHTEVVPGRYLMVAVSDDGCGMDQETRQRIFEPFFTTKGVGKGTGLGLATVYGIVRQHGGNIWVYSEPGKGTTFKCYFPIVDAEPVAEEAAAEAEVSLEGGLRTILLVEDDEMVRAMVQEFLAGQGFQVLDAGTAEEALNISKGRQLDLLITDVVMPDLNGPELYTRLLEGHAGLRALYMSGYTHNVIVHQGVLEEGIHYIQKPFDAASFTRKVQSVLQS
ncbi:ATP-binding protein [Geomonas sp. Red32]|uniref:hybrid sensor histidine kinase/response regulator n=1 Tax=Geomonas sp. Red32 TaxID=2912856 RepID=UPI00202CAB81|nr:hybrid sensor histidine kinase/response regulator [Geomonas sp. Red32]MCM0082592.1 ATP-binding protein [Geomonas sp. Red32]